MQEEMTTQLKVIETVYRGHLFRSRIEARWAVFYDALGVPWEYEKEGFDLDGSDDRGSWYLPDFWLPEQDCFVEIKGEIPKLIEEIKASVLSQKSGKIVHIFYGPLPTIERYGGWGEELDEQSGVYTFTPKVKMFSGFLWGRSITSGEYQVGPISKDFDSATDSIVHAYNEARSARF